MLPVACSGQAIHRRPGRVLIGGPQRRFLHLAYLIAGQGIDEQHAPGLFEPRERVADRRQHAGFIDPASLAPSRVKAHGARVIPPPVLG